jgi:hypothetical protein
LRAAARISATESFFFSAIAPVPRTRGKSSGIARPPSQLPTNSTSRRPVTVESVARAAEPVARTRGHRKNCAAAPEEAPHRGHARVPPIGVTIDATVTFSQSSR